MERGHRKDTGIQEPGNRGVKGQDGHIKWAKRVGLKTPEVCRSGNCQVANQKQYRNVNPTLHDLGP